jgi:hypothetical protein
MAFAAIFKLIYNNLYIKWLSIICNIGGYFMNVLKNKLTKALFITLLSVITLAQGNPENNLKPQTEKLLNLFSTLSPEQQCKFLKKLESLRKKQSIQTSTWTNKIFNWNNAKYPLIIGATVFITLYGPSLFYKTKDYVYPTIKNIASSGYTWGSNQFSWIKNGISNWWNNTENTIPSVLKKMQDTYKKIPKDVRNIKVKDLNQNLTDQISNLKKLLRLSQANRNRIATQLNNL